MNPIYLGAITRQLMINMTILSRQDILCGVAFILMQGFLLEAGSSLDPSLSSDSVALTLESIPQEVVDRNLDLKAARWTIESARKRMQQSGRLSNPSIQTTYQDNARTSERSVGFGIQQSFPVTARLRLEKNVARNQIQEAQAEVATVARRRIESALEFGVLLLGIHHRQDVLKDQIRLAEELATFLETQSKRAEASPLDATHAALQVDELKLELRPLQAQTKQLESELRSFLGLEPDVVVLMEGALSTADLPAASEMPFEKRPEIQLIHRQIGTMQETLKLERANRVEDFRLGLVHQWNREEDVPIGIEAERQYGLQLSVPLPFWNRNEGRIGEVMSELRRLESSLGAQKIAILNQVDAAYTAMLEHLAAYQQINQQLLPRRNAYLKDLEVSYRQGLTPFEFLLKARERMLELRFAEVKALESFHVNRIKYLSATGEYTDTHEN